MVFAQAGLLPQPNERLLDYPPLEQKLEPLHLGYLRQILSLSHPDRPHPSVRMGYHFQLQPQALYGFPQTSVPLVRNHFPPPRPKPQGQTDPKGPSCPTCRARSQRDHGP